MFHAGFGNGPAEDYADLGRLNSGLYDKFSRRLVERGVIVANRGIWYLSAAHTGEDIERTLEIAAIAMADLADDEALTALVQ